MPRKHCVKISQITPVQRNGLPRESTIGAPLQSLAKLCVDSGSRRSVNGIFTLLAFTQRILVVCCRRFETTYRFHLRGSSIQTFRDNVSVPSSRVKHSDVSGQRIGPIFEGQAFRRFGTTYRSHLQGSRILTFRNVSVPSSRVK